jgi:hypothetical protein
MHGSPCHDPLLKSKFCFSGMSSARNQGFSCVLSRAIYFQVPWIFQVQTKQFSISSWRSTVATQSIITLIEIPNIFTIQLINFIYILRHHTNLKEQKKKKHQHSSSSLFSCQHLIFLLHLRPKQHSQQLNPPLFTSTVLPSFSINPPASLCRSIT